MSSQPENEEKKSSPRFTIQRKATESTVSTSGRSKPRKTKRIKFHKLGVNPNDILKVGDMRLTVRKPEAEMLGEWLTTNSVEIYKEIEFIYGVLADYCTKESCPSMTAGRRFEYLWADGVKYIQPVKLTAPDYVKHLMIWVEKMLEPYVNKRKLTENGEFVNKSWKKAFRNIFKRLFRVYAHIYHSHMKIIEELNIQKHLNTSFKRFVMFVDEFSIITLAHMEPLADLVRKMLGTAVK